MCHRLLIVEDEAYISELLSVVLEEEGYTVAVVSDGRDALGALAASSYDLVLSDVMLPRLDGLGLVEAMQADDDLRAIPIVLMSAAPPCGIGTVPHAAFVPKPFDLDQLLDTIETVLRPAS